ncbi:MAG TPA: hypothetical protein VGF67_04900 [Ktedonobacteraceae bacterium]|jgi:hypothetical protein
MTRDTHTRLQEQLTRAQEAVEESRRACDLFQGEDPREHLQRLIGQLVDQEHMAEQAEQAAHQSLVLESSHEIQAALSACEAERRSTLAARQQQEMTSARLLQEALADQGYAQELLLRVREAVAQ